MTFCRKIISRIERSERIILSVVEKPFACGILGKSEDIFGYRFDENVFSADKSILSFCARIVNCFGRILVFDLNNGARIEEVVVEALAALIHVKFNRSGSVAAIVVIYAVYNDSFISLALGRIVHDVAFSNAVVDNAVYHIEYALTCGNLLRTFGSDIEVFNVTDGNDLILCYFSTDKIIFTVYFNKRIFACGGVEIIHSFERKLRLSFLQGIFIVSGL